METKDLVGLGALKQIDKARTEKIQPRNVKKSVSSHNETIASGDRVEISGEGRKLQGSSDELKVTKKLLGNLPNVRAHVVYEALAKLKAGLYSNEEIVSAAAEKLLESGELDDIITS